MKIKLTRTLMLFVAVLILSGGLTAYAATLFSQTFAGQTFATGNLTAGSCGSTLVLDTSVSTIPSFAGNPATLEYACSTSEAPAFTSASGTGGVTVTPTFTIPPGWSLKIDNPGGSCTGGGALTSGTPISIANGQSLVYCLTSSSATTFGSFSIQWAQ